MTWSKFIAATALALGATSALVQGSGAQQAAQSPPDEAGAIYAVVNTLYEQLIADGHLQPGGTIAITPHRIALQQRSPGQRLRFEQGRAVGNKLRMQLADLPGPRITTGELDSIRVCTSRFPSSCRLDGADAVISFDEVTGTEQSATVVVRMVHQVPIDTRQPVHTVVMRIELVRERSRWVVSSQTIIMIS